MNTHSIRFRLIVLYVGLLTGILVLFCAFTYIGVRHYLKWTLEELLARRANQLSELISEEVPRNSDTQIADEISKRFAPEINDRFIRVTRADGSALYISNAPRDASFNPKLVPALRESISRQSVREVALPNGAQLLIVAIPSTINGRSFFIEVGAPDSSAQTVLKGLLTTFALSLPVVAAIAVGSGFFLVKRALMPIDEITESAERITLRNLSERLPIARTGDELERLSRALNRMISRLEESFHHSSRFTADASHELRTPLTVLRGDKNGVVSIPFELAADIPQMVAQINERERRIIELCRSSDFSLDKLFESVNEMRDIVAAAKPYYVGEEGLSQ